MRTIRDVDMLDPSLLQHALSELQPHTLAKLMVLAPAPSRKKMMSVLSERVRVNLRNAARGVNHVDDGEGMRLENLLLSIIRRLQRDRNT